MKEKCGDDLVAARRFMNLCQGHMSEIFSGGQLPLIDVVHRLSDIQSQAKLMHARAIYRSAQNVIDELTLRKCPQSCAASALVLQKLIRQYETGLSEIAPVKIHPSEIKVSAAKKPLSSNPVGTDIVYDFTLQKMAADTLAPLVKFSDGKDRDNLVSLLDLAANEARPRTQNSNPAAKTTPKISKSQKIDIILPSLTNHWLRLARTQGKSISVSSAIDDALVKTETLKTLHIGLKKLGEVLISQSVEKPDVRAGKELSRSAHLAITGRQSAGGFELLASCEGVAPRAEDIALVKAILQSIDITATLESDEQLVRVEFSGLVVEGAQPIKKKVVEAAL